MGKKKKGKVKRQKDKSKIEERIKEVKDIEIPDENPHKMDNERRIEKFWRYGRNKHRTAKSIKDKNRKKYN